MSEARYVVRPKADQDLDDQAFYYATEANPELGHRFLVSAHETFSLLSTQPEMGWNPKLHLSAWNGLRLFRVTGFEKILILYRPLENGVEILRVIHGSQNLQRLLRRQRIE
ncbi:MAG: type II toxin-antitoxin system RelE/ParE family toxin [Acidobacteriota bacterium]